MYYLASNILKTGKNMYFMIEGGTVLEKYNEIWIKVKKTLNIKYSTPVYDEKYIKVKLKRI